MGAAPVCSEPHPCPWEGKPWVHFMKQVLGIPGQLTHWRSPQKRASERTGQRGCLGWVRFRETAREGARGSTPSGSDERLWAPSYKLALGLGALETVVEGLLPSSSGSAAAAELTGVRCRSPFGVFLFCFLNQTQEDCPRNMYWREL